MVRGERRVLIVDDERAVREGIARCLKGRGFRCDTAATVREACFKLEHDGPWLAVLADLKLEDEDGLDVVRFARSLRRPVSALAMTGWNDPAHHNRSVPLNVVLMRKPLDMDVVVGLLAELQEQRTQRERLMRAAVDAFCAKFDLSPYGERRLVVIIGDNAVGPGGFAHEMSITESQMDGVRAAVLRKCRMSNTGQIRDWLYDHALRALEVQRAG